MTHTRLAEKDIVEKSLESYNDVLLQFSHAELIIQITQELLADSV